MNDLVPHKKTLYRPLKLTPQMKRFADLYFGECDRNTEAAATGAGYKNKLKGYDIIKKPQVRDYIRQLMQDGDFDLELAPRFIFNNTEARANCDPLDYLERDAEGFLRVKRLEDIPKNIRRCIKNICEVRMKGPDGNLYPGIKYEFHDAIKASELLGRWMGMDSRADPLLMRNEAQPEWAGLIVEGLPEERTEDTDGQTREQRAEQGRQVRALSAFGDRSEAIEITGDPSRAVERHDRSGTFEG